MKNTQQPRRLHLLVAGTGDRDVRAVEAVVNHFRADAQVEIKVVVDDLITPRLDDLPTFQSRSTQQGYMGAEMNRDYAFQLVQWVDLLVLAPLDADNMAKMMCGIADTLILEVLRGWDTSKRILLVPGMNAHMWENPMTKRQISKLHRKWTWVRVLPPLLWEYAGPVNLTDLNLPLPPKRRVEWKALDELVGIVKNQADLLSLGHEIDVSGVQHGADAKPGRRRCRVALPPEIWSLIFEYTDDWELARALGVFTRLDMPTGQGWRSKPHNPDDPLQLFMHELEWTLLTADTHIICAKLAQAPPDFHDLSALAIKLICKFSLKDILLYLETNYPHVFKCFDSKTIPTKASAYYGRTQILDWWVRSPCFLEKQYDAEALDGASKHGYLHVLEWWRRSGLPLKFTEAALEQASARGHLTVLEFWRELHFNDSLVSVDPGRSLLTAAQYGQLAVIRWWEDNGIAVGHQELVPKMASRYGQVAVLELWRELKGDDKLQFDSSVLVEPTIYGHTAVLDWWKKYAHNELPGMDERKGRRVEYKTMDIEVALDDALGDQRAVRKWWAENGLNLGLGTSEWMKAVYL